MCTGQSSHPERASAESQSSAVTPQFNLSFSFVDRFSKHLIEFIAIDRSMVVSAIAVLILVDNNLSSSLHC